MAEPTAGVERGNGMAFSGAGSSGTAGSLAVDDSIAAAERLGFGGSSSKASEVATDAASEGVGGDGSDGAGSLASLGCSGRDLVARSTDEVAGSDGEGVDVTVALAAGGVSASCGAAVALGGDDEVSTVEAVV